MVEAVADREGVRPRELDCLLAEAIDPVALDHLFDPVSSTAGGADGHVRFPYCGYEVTVRSDWTVEVSPGE